MNLAPNFTLANAVVPIPINGSNTVVSLLKPWSFIHISGSFSGKTVGCGLDSCIVSSRINQAFPRSLKSSRADFHRPMFDLS